MRADRIPAMLMTFGGPLDGQRTAVPHGETRYLYIDPDQYQMAIYSLDDPPQAAALALEYETYLVEHFWLARPLAAYDIWGHRQMLDRYDLRCLRHEQYPMRKIYKILNWLADISDRSLFT